MRQILCVCTQTRHIDAQHSTSRHTPTGTRLDIFVAAPAMALVQANPDAYLVKPEAAAPVFDNSSWTLLLKGYSDSMQQLFHGSFAYIWYIAVQHSTSPSSTTHCRPAQHIGPQHSTSPPSPAQAYRHRICNLLISRERWCAFAHTWQIAA